MPDAVPDMPKTGECPAGARCRTVCAEGWTPYRGHDIDDIGHYLSKILHIEIQRGAEGHCYKRRPIDASVANYAAAREDCRVQGLLQNQHVEGFPDGYPSLAYIAVPNSLAENKFLTGKVMNPDLGEIWIGYDFENAERWEDGSPLDMTNSWRPIYHKGVFTVPTTPDTGIPNAHCRQEHVFDGINTGQCKIATSLDHMPVVRADSLGAWEFTSDTTPRVYICETSGFPMRWHNEW